MLNENSSAGTIIEVAAIIASGMAGPRLNLLILSNVKAVFVMSSLISAALN
jgi:hypothetical protein